MCASQLKKKLYLCGQNDLYTNLLASKYKPYLLGTEQLRKNDVRILDSDESKDK